MDERSRLFWTSRLHRSSSSSPFFFGVSGRRSLEAIRDASRDDDSGVRRGYISTILDVDAFLGPFWVLQRRWKKYFISFAGVFPHRKEKFFFSERKKNMANKYYGVKRCIEKGQNIFFSSS